MDHHQYSKFFVGAKSQNLKSEIIQILQSHYPPYGNVQVILLKFKTVFSNIYDHKNANLIYGGR